MRGKGEGKKGEWPWVIKKEKNRQEGRQREYRVSTRGIIKGREREKERGKRETVKSNGRKKGGYKGVILGARQ